MSLKLRLIIKYNKESKNSKEIFKNIEKKQKNEFKLQICDLSDFLKKKGEVLNKFKRNNLEKK